MTIIDWFDILLDGIQRGLAWLASIDIGGLSLLTYLMTIFVTGLMFTLFLNVIDTGVSFGSNMVSRRRYNAMRADIQSKRDAYRASSKSRRGGKRF